MTIYSFFTPIITNNVFLSFEIFEIYKTTTNYMFYIGFDIGSSSVKVAIVEIATGKSVGVAQEPETEMSILALKNGWAEQKPEDWWLHACNAVAKLKKKYNISRTQIKGIGISYQMHGLVLVDAAGLPLRKSIIWCDSRAVEIGNEAFASIDEKKCNEHLLNSPGNFTASKLKWVKDNEPEIYSQIHKFMLPGDYIAYKLSNVINTTISGLSEGIMWDFKNDSFADFLFEHYGISTELVPDIVDTFCIQSKVDATGALESGLAEGTPIFYRAGDQPNNALSLNVFNPGEVAATGGTSGVVYAMTNSLSVKESSRVNNFAHVNYKKGNEPRAERMFNNKDIGTRLVNVNLNNHGKAHICRAALEGIAFSFVYGMEIMKSDGIEVNVLRAGNDNLFRSEIFSNTVATLIGHEIEIYNTTGAIGAARASGLHEGDFETFGKYITDNDHLMTYMPFKDKQPYLEAYQLWKNELELIINK